MIVPMIAALCLPTLLLESGARFEQAVSDSIASQVVEELSVDQQGVTLTMNGRLHAEDIGPARTLATDRLAGVDELGPATRTIYSRRGRGVVLVGDADEPLQIRASSRFFARQGAIESLDLIAVDPTIRGVYVSEDLAARTDATTGSLINVEIEDSGAVVPVEGIYRDLWPTTPAYWDQVPSVLVPRFSPVFNTPTVELLIIREADINQLGVPGVLRIDAPIARSPRTLMDLERLSGRLRAVERDIARDGELVEALQAFAGLDEPIPMLQSSTPDALADVRTAIQRIDQPLLAAQAAGLGLGLLVVVAAASFTARQQAKQLRLLVNEGKRRPGIAMISVAQYLTPAIVGMLLGLAIGRSTIGLFVPSANQPVMSDTRTLIATTAVAVALIGVTRGHLAVRLAERSTAEVGGVPFAVVLLLAGVTAAAWFQAGQAARTTDVDPLVVAFPIVALCAAMGIGLGAFRWLIRRAQRITRRLPPVAMFTVRRIGHSQTGVLGLAGALGVAVGIVVFATVVGNTRTVSLESKTTSRIGGEATAVLRAGQADVALLPDDATAIHTKATRLTPGSGRVNVVAIDPETFAETVDWPRSFGQRSAEEVVALLGQRSTEVMRNDPVRAIALAGRPVTGRGAFGFVETFSYEVVAEIDSFPFAAARGPTILISADALEQTGRLRFENDIRREFGADADISQLEDRYESPLRTFRVNAVSQRGASDFEAQLTDAGIGYRDVVSRADLVGTVDEQATKWSVDYFRFVGLVAVIAALCASVLAHRERVELTRLRARMAAPLGLPLRVSVIAAALEGIVLALVAVALGIGAALAVAARVVPRLDPLGEIPPAIGLDVPVIAVVLTGVVVLTVVGTIGLVSEWWTTQREVRSG